jgi:TIR domain
VLGTRSRAIQARTSKIAKPKHPPIVCEKGGRDAQRRSRRSVSLPRLALPRMPLDHLSIRGYEPELLPTCYRRKLQMPHDAIITYSNAAKLTAYAICNELESSRIRCWIVPRDLSAGAGWDESITRAVESSRIVILVLTEYAQRSDRVERQLEVAFNNGAVVIPFRAESDQVSYESSSSPNSLHWIDAITPEVATQIGLLREHVRAIVGNEKIRPGPEASNRQVPRTNPGASADPHAKESTLDKDNLPIDNPASASSFGDKSLAIARFIDEKPASTIQRKPSKLFVISALFLVLVPFAIIVGVGIWQVESRREIAHIKPASSPGALISQTVPSPTVRGITPTPAVSATRPPQVTVRRRDLITPSDPGWGATDANWSIADNKIRITPLPGNGAIIVNTGHRFSEVEFTADVVMSKGEDLDQLGGLVFWAKDYNDCYALVISADGRFAIGHKLFGRWINPTAKAGNGAVKTGIGQVNKLSVQTYGKQFTAIVNGVSVVTLTGEKPQGDWFIGLYGESAEASENTWDFTNVTAISALK